MEEQQVEAVLDHPFTAEDQGMFARVWGRVMPDQSMSPIELGPAPDAIVPAPGQGGWTEEPGGCGAPVEGAERLTPLLRQLMEGAQRGRRSYQQLARHAQGTAGRQLAGMAGEESLSFKRLETVCFLLTGQQLAVRPWNGVPSGTLRCALREQYLWEQERRQTCLEAARLVRSGGDPLLTQLLLELGEQSALHMEKICHILEGMARTYP